MNRYYLSIFDKLGYQVLNPNQAEINLLYKGTNRSVPKHSDIDGYRYQDDNSNLEIKFEESYNRYRVYLDGEILLTFGCDREEEFGEGIFNVLLYVDRSTFVRISVGEYPMGDIREEAGRINITIVDYQKGTKRFNIHQKYDGAQLIWREEMKYHQKMEREVTIKDCTLDSYYSRIIRFLETNIGGLDNNVQCDNNLQKGFYLIEQGLKEAISDLCDYWKNNILPYVNQEGNNIVK